MVHINEEKPATDAVQDKPKFTIENNIIVGEKLELPDEPFNSGAVILNTLKSNPDFVGQVEALTGRQSTFEEMRVRSVKCAVWLKKQGVKKGDIVGLCADNHLDAYVPFLGTLYIGAICATWDHQLAINSTRHYLSLVQPRIVFVHAHSVGVLEQAAKELGVKVRPIVFESKNGDHETLDETLDAQADSEVEEFVCTTIDRAGDVAAICNSSGTTGLPKATQLTHRAFRAVFASGNTGHIQDNVSMWSPTLRWQYGIVVSLKTIRTLSKRVVVPDYDDAAAYCEFIEKYGVNWFSTDPSIVTQMLKGGFLSKYRFPKLKNITVSGSSFRADLQAECAKLLPHVDVLQSYGLTDAGSVCATQTKGCQPGSCGFLLKGNQLKIVDLEKGETLGPNQRGEIWLKTQSMMAGYLNDPAATKRAIDADGWLHTGDTGYYTEDGEIFVVGRISEFIDYRTIKVSTAEIEAVLINHPAVGDVAVVGRPHEVDGQHPLAIVCKMPDKEVTDKELIELVDKCLPDYCKLRGGVEFIDKLPRTTTGKVSRIQLKNILNTLCQ